MMEKESNNTKHCTIVNLVFSIQCKLQDITGEKNNRNELVSGQK